MLAARRRYLPWYAARPDHVVEPDVQTDVFDVADDFFGDLAAFNQPAAPVADAGVPRHPDEAAAGAGMQAFLDNINNLIA